MMSLSDKNTQLARENNEIKAQLREKEKEIVEMMKRSVKAEYYAHNTYKDVIKMISNGVICMEECITVCKQVMEAAEKGYANLRGLPRGAPPAGPQQPIHPVPNPPVMPSPAMAVLQEKDPNQEPAKRKKKCGNKTERLRCMRAQYGKQDSPED